jgi:hypothetical protein
MLNPKIIRNIFEEIMSPAKFNSSAMYPMIIRFIAETIIAIIEIIVIVNPLTMLFRFLRTNKIMEITIKLIIKVIYSEIVLLI